MGGLSVLSEAEWDTDATGKLMDVVANGAFVPTNCMTPEIKNAVMSGLSYIEKEFNFKVSLAGLHACESQATATQNIYLEVSVTDPSGKVWAFELDVSKTLLDVCPKQEANNNTLSLVDCYKDNAALLDFLSRDVTKVESEEDARRILQQYGVTNLNHVDEFANQALVSKDKYADPATPPVDETGAAGGRAALLSVTLLAFAFAGMTML